MKTLSKNKKSLQSAEPFQLYLSIQILLAFACSCNEVKMDKECTGTVLKVETPHGLQIEDLCDYYSWANFYANGKIMHMDSSMTNYYCIESNVDSVKVYANGDGYTIIDTSFTINGNYILLNYRNESKIYFDTHQKAYQDISRKNIEFTTEDHDYFLLDSAFQFMEPFNAKIDFVDWDVPGRDERFTYNCIIEKYIHEQDSLFFQRQFNKLDSLMYLELDILCGKRPSVDKLKLLQQMSDFNLDVKAHISDQYSQHYLRYYRDDLDQLKPNTASILDSLKNHSDYYFIRLAEVYSYENPKEMFIELVSMLQDTTFVGLTNSADLIYWERIESGDLKFYGHGGSVYDDVFTRSGRANHLLATLTGTRLGNVRMNPDLKYLEKLKCRWETYIDLIEF